MFMLFSRIKKTINKVLEMNTISDLTKVFAW